MEEDNKNYKRKYEEYLKKSEEEKKEGKYQKWLSEEKRKERNERNEEFSGEYPLLFVFMIFISGLTVFFIPPLF